MDKFLWTLFALVLVLVNVPFVVWGYRFNLFAVGFIVGVWVAVMMYLCM